MSTGGPGRTFFHCDACERHRGFDRLKGTAHLAGRAFPDEDWQAINFARRLQEERRCEVEVVDLAGSFWRRIKLRRRGIGKTPTFVVDDEVLPPIASFDQLAEFLAVELISLKGGFRGGRRRQRKDEVLADVSGLTSSAVRP
jgi:hypothetical protein